MSRTRNQQTVEYYIVATPSDPRMGGLAARRDIDAQTDAEAKTSAAEKLVNSLSFLGYDYAALYKVVGSKTTQIATVEIELPSRRGGPRRR